MKRLIIFGFISCLCFLSCHVYAATYNGQIKKIIKDDFLNKRSVEVYSLKTSNNSSYELDIPQKIEKNSDFHFGDVVIIDGDLIEGKPNSTKVNSIKVTKKYESSVKNFVTQLNILTMIVDFTDHKASSTTSYDALKQMLFTNPTSVAKNYALSTANQVQFIPNPSTPNNPGIYNINLNYPIGNSCDYEKWANDALNVAAQMGVDINSYTEKLTILPVAAQNICGWAGLAYLGCCRAWVMGYSGDFTGIIAHELGHNLGMHHSNSAFNNRNVEYGDQSDFMGYGANRPLNAAHRYMLGVYRDYPYKALTVTESGQYIINALDSDPEAVQVLQISRRMTGNWYYYVSFRTNNPPFSMVAPYLNKVNVHFSDHPSVDTHSYLVATLGLSESFIDNDNLFRVDVISTFMDCAVIVYITLG